MLIREPRHFCRAFFSDFPKSDMVLNNWCESFNNSIFHARDKYILTMCESLRIYLMTRIQQNRDRMNGSVLKICPKIIKILEQNKEKIGDLIACKANEDNYQVEDISGFVNTYKVNLKQRHCSCRRWDLTGIPCNHAIAAIRSKGGVPEDYVDHYIVIVWMLILGAMNQQYCQFIHQIYGQKLVKLLHFHLSIKCNQVDQKS